MARPQKNGLDYFPLDIDICQDDKIMLVESEFGITGFGIIIKMFCRIYENGYYYPWEEKEQLLFSKRIDVAKNEVINCINSAIKWNIFNQEIYNKYQILTSKGIQKRYVEAIARRKSIELIKEYWLLEYDFNDKIEISFINVNINEVNVDNNDYINEINVNINSQSKVKKSKEKKRKENKIIDENIFDDNKLSSPPPPSKKPHIDYEYYINRYNEICKSLPQVKIISESRKREIRNRLKTYSKKQIEKAFTMAEESEFLKGENDRKWKADFDWIIKDSNIAKILDGKYQAKKETQNETSKMDYQQRSSDVIDFNLYYNN